LRSMSNLAVLYRLRGKYAQAEPLYTEVIEIDRRVLGEDHPDTLRSMNNLAVLYNSQGKYAEAESVFTKVLEAKRRVLGPQHPESLDGLVSLGLVHLKQQNFGRAEALFRELLRILEKNGPDTWRRYYAQTLLGASLTGQKRYVEAEPLLVVGSQGMAQREASIPPTYRSLVAWAGTRIVQLYESWGKAETAAEWRTKLHVK
jgi:tetratricopeptide (TPR) repeat protein